MGFTTTTPGEQQTPPGQPKSWPQRYPDTWRTLFENLQRGGGANDLYTNLIGNFKGGQDMTDFLNWAAPFIASSLYSSPGRQYAANPANWDDSGAAYAGGAGRIAQQGRAAQTAGEGSLARAGLGRSGAMANFASQSQLGVGNAQGELWSNLYQQGVQNKLNAAQKSFDIDQSIMQMALGFSPQPRQKQQGGVSSDVASGLGSAVGIIGAALI